MAKQVIGFEATFDGAKVEKSVKSIKTELREAQNEAIQLGRKFGELSPEALDAAKKVAKLKDEVGDFKNRVDALNPDAKFKAFSQSLQGVAGGFAGVQGAIGLFGTESKELEKQLLKVQSALALSQGLDALLEAKDSFKTLAVIVRTNVVSAFSTLKGAIISTGIGALVVGVGLLIANFDAVKKVVLNFIPGLAKVGDFIGKLVDNITDFVGATSDASRAYDKLSRSTSGANDEIGRRISLLKAQGGKETEIAELSKRQSENSLNVLRAKLKSEGKLNDEDLKQFKDLKNQKLIIDAEEQKRLNEIAETRRKAAIEAAAKARKDEEDRRAAEVKRLEDIEVVRVGIVNNGEQSLKTSKASSLGEQMIASEAAKIKQQQDAVELYEFNKKIAEEEFNVKQNNTKRVSALLSGFADLAGRQTAVGKTLAIADATINTYLAASQVLSAKSPLYIANPFLRFTSAALTIATGLKNVKSILAVKVPSGGGGGNLPSDGGAASAPTQAPIASAVQVAQTQSVGTSSVNIANQGAVKAFVVERDITDSQDRISKIKSAATF